jgi:hypothetical protein
MVFGVNVAANFNPPHGQLDVWVPLESVAAVTGWSEKDVREALLRKQLTAVADIRGGQFNPFWIRLKTSEEAQALVQQLGEFAQEAPTP